MMYEEFKKLSNRTDVSIDLYDRAVEPLYLDGYKGLDKAEFCKMIKSIPVDVLEMMARCYDAHKKLESDANALQKKEATASEQAKELQKMNGDLACELIRAHQEKHTLELRVMFAPESTVRDLRAANFENYPTCIREAENMGIAPKR